MKQVLIRAFRQIIAKYGRPDVFFTEFVSADGLAHPKAREKLLIDLKYTEGEHPIVAQIFGGKPENIKEAAALCQELGFDGVDINMGCPDKSIEKQCAGAAAMKDMELARKIIRAAREGASGLPISVKTRIGYNKDEIDTWIAGLLAENLSALTVHLRTRKEMSNVPAHWDVMLRIIELRNKISPETLIIGNGDVIDLKDAKEKAEKYGCDGIMLGRAIFGNPWLFDNATPPASGHLPLAGEEIRKKLEVMIEHTHLFEKMLGGVKNFSIMKKHYKAYVKNALGASASGGSARGGKELRMELMEAPNADEVERIVKIFLAGKKE